jgi:hypothetical protein
MLASKGTVYETERTGDSSDPCGTPTGCLWSSDNTLLKHSLILLLARNDHTQATSSSAKPMLSNRAVMLWLT